MRPAEVIAARSPEWRALEEDVAWLRETRPRRLDGARVAAFARRYRAACSDLGLAQGARFPDSTVDYLQQLVADAHTQLYRIESFSIVAWLRDLLVGVPRRVVRDPCTWIAAAVFVVTFVGAIAAALVRAEFATAVVGDAMLTRIETMYADGLDGGLTDVGTTAVGGYVVNNAGIGLRCFASGILGGIGSLVILASNGVFLGAVFGHMIGDDSAATFLEFVTAHAPCELTAIVLSAAAGLRLGWALVDTRGWGRWESLRRTAREALGTAGMATVLFFLAALIEAYVSPSPLPLAAKRGVAVASAVLLVGWLAWAGWGAGRRHADAT